VFTADRTSLRAHADEPLLAGVAILCIAVGAGASASLNMWFDADIDANMRRTAIGRSRPAGCRAPTPGARHRAVAVLVAMMALAINLLAAGLLAFNHPVLRRGLHHVAEALDAAEHRHRRLAGALPPVIGWARRAEPRR